MRLPNELTIEHRGHDTIYFRTACGCAEGCAKREDGYGESSYEVIGFELLSKSGDKPHSKSVVAASDALGHFRIIGQTGSYILGPTPVRDYFCFSVEALGFDFEVDVSDLERLGLHDALSKPNEDGEVYIQDGCFPEGTWVSLEIKDFTIWC